MSLVFTFAHAFFTAAIALAGGGSVVAATGSILLGVATTFGVMLVGVAYYVRMDSR